MGETIVKEDGTVLYKGGGCKVKITGKRESVAVEPEPEKKADKPAKKKAAKKADKPAEE